MSLWKWSETLINDKILCSIPHLYGCGEMSNCQQLSWLCNSYFKRITKETSKLCITVPLWGESNIDRWISPHYGPVMLKVYPCHHVIMTFELWCYYGYFGQNKPCYGGTILYLIHFPLLCRWANQGLDFLSYACDPKVLGLLTEEQFVVSPMALAVTVPLWRESPSHWWIPPTKGQ